MFNHKPTFFLHPLTYKNKQTKVLLTKRTLPT